MDTPATYSERAHAYCRRVVAKKDDPDKQIASKWIQLRCKECLDDLNRSAYSNEWEWQFDPVRADRVCAFIERLKLSNGDPFILSDWQVWFTCSLMGWVNAQGMRKYREAVLLVPKGNGKSPWAAAFGLWMAFFDGRRDAEVYCGALSKDQAKTVYSPAYFNVTNQPVFAKLGIVAQAESIFNKQTGARFKSVIGKGRHGTRPYFFCIDEAHQFRDDDLFGTARTGCNKVPNSLLLTISTAGVAALNNPCYQLQQRAEDALQGVKPDPRFFAAIYCADDTVEWDSDEAIRMANPNLGISNDETGIREAIERAKSSPAEQNNVRAMHLDQWTTGAAAWLNPALWQACYDAALTEDSVRHLPSWFGLDVAMIHDLTAVVRLYRDDSKGDKPHYYIWCHCYLPSDTLNDPANTQLQGWEKQGLITATAGSELDLSVLKADILTEAAKQSKFQALCYDPTFARDLTQALETDNNITRLETPQKSMALSPAMYALEAAIEGGRISHDGNPVLLWCLANMQTRKYPQGNYAVPHHDGRPEAKIDAGMALLFAMAHASVYEPKKKAGFAYGKLRSF